MSVGLQLLHAVCTSGARNVFRRLQAAHFTEDEQPAFAFVADYFDRYGGLPSTTVMQENGLFLYPSSGSVEYHVDALRNRTIYNIYARDQQRLMGYIHRGAMTDFVAAMESMVTEMRSVETRRDTYTLTDAVALAIADYEAARSLPGLRGVTYGYETLDEVTGGARPGDLHTIVARPGIGKSWLIARMACSAWQAGASVVFVSMEMMAIETARRILAIGSGINTEFIQRGHLSPWGEQQLRATAERVGSMPPFHLLVGDLSKSTRDVEALVQEHAPDVVYLDAGYLLNPTKDKGLRKRFELVSDTNKELKSLCTKGSVPIVQTVQFNRVQKQDEAMSLDNIGGTDEIGQLSSFVLGLRKGVAPYEYTRRRASIIKNRHGRENFDMTLRFEMSPYNMDEIPEDEGPSTGTTEDGEWDGVQGPAPTMTEWSV